MGEMGKDMCPCVFVCDALLCRGIFEKRLLSTVYRLSSTEAYPAH